MSPGTKFALQLANPRGRYDRVDFIWAAITLLAAQLAFALGLWATNASFMGWRGAVANLAFGWLGYSAISKRLHDLGHSGWWLLGAVAAWVAGAIGAALVVVLVAGLDMLATGTPAFWAIFCAVMAPPLALALWLHLAEGQAGPNRYGPVPIHPHLTLQPA